MVGAKVQLVNLELGRVHSLFRLATLGFCGDGSRVYHVPLASEKCNLCSWERQEDPILFLISATMLFPIHATTAIYQRTAQRRTRSHAHIVEEFALQWFQRLHGEVRQ